MPFQKWLDQIEPQQTIADAATVSLRQRLGAVSYYLPLAARSPEQTTEHVHQLRVWCRRSLAAVAIYEKLLPPKEVKWITKWLCRVRKAAGKARDLDVLMKRYDRRRHKHRDQRFVVQLRKLRKKAQRPIVQLHKEIGRSGKFDRHVNRLIESIKKDQSEVFQSWAGRQLNHATASFYADLPSQQPSIEELHRFRVSGKQLRYSMELLAQAFPSAFRESLYPIVSTLQVHLGDLNDHATAAERMKKMAKKHPSKRLKKLLAKERRATKDAVRHFHDWWTPQRTQDFFRVLHRITHPSQAS